MRVLAMVCGLALLSSSCATTARYFENPAVGKKTTQQYKDPVEENLFDPDSSRYRNIRYYSPKSKGKKITVMCGKYNAKNRMGGYTGYKRFVSDSVHSDKDSYSDEYGKMKNKIVDCLCHNGEVPSNCTGGGSVGPHCVAWLLFMYGGGWLWAKCY